MNLKNSTFATKLLKLINSNNCSFMKKPWKVPEISLIQWGKNKKWNEMKWKQMNRGKSWQPKEKGISVLATILIPAALGAFPHPQN